MKSLKVYYDSNLTLQTAIEELPIPKPPLGYVLIHVSHAGSNPKDLKHPLPTIFNNAINQGSDCAGIVAALGDGVKSFQLGERVAGFHEMDTLHGTYAEYALCPETTVLRIPDSMSCAKAATIPLAAFTAAVGLYCNLNLPMPWSVGKSIHSEHGDSIPLVVNAASGAVGAFAVKLAKLNPCIRPIIAIAGRSGDWVKVNLKPDVVLDYRSETIAEDLKEALGGVKVRHVFDAMNTIKSVRYLSQVMDSKGCKYTCTVVAHGDQSPGVDDEMKEVLSSSGATCELAFVGDVHEQLRPEQDKYQRKPAGRLFGAVMSVVLERSVMAGYFGGHPYQMVKGGLEGVEDALLELRDRNTSGNAKFVTRIADTSGVAQQVSDTV